MRIVSDRDDISSNISIYKGKMNLEKEILSNKRLFDNEIRMEEVKEAKQYFNIKKQEQELTDKQWIAFFAYCTYYLQIKN